MRELRNTTLQSENLEGRVHLGYLDVDENNIKMYLEETASESMKRTEMVQKGPMAKFWEHGNEKNRQFLDQLSHFQFSRSHGIGS
jgi:hypothetical protein